MNEEWLDESFNENDSIQELHVETNQKSSKTSAKVYGTRNTLSVASSRPSSSTSSILNEEMPNKSSCRTSKKRKQSEDVYVDAIHSLAQTLKTSTTPINNPINKDEDVVNNCMKFIGSLLKDFPNSELKLEVMNTLIQTVINVKTEYLIKS